MPNATLVDNAGHDVGTAGNPLYVALGLIADGVYDTVNGTKTAVTASATVITPPTGCTLMDISSDVNIYVNTAGATAVDNGTSALLYANVVYTIPVTAGIAVKALSASGTATVRCMPYKARA